MKLAWANRVIMARIALWALVAMLSGCVSGGDPGDGREGDIAACGGESYPAPEGDRTAALLEAFEEKQQAYELASDRMDRLELQGLSDGDSQYEAAAYQGASMMLEMFALCECLAEELPDMRTVCNDLQSVPSRFFGPPQDV